VNRERRGAVLVPILASAPPGVIFVERAGHLRRNPGQIAFPGGIAEDIDRGDPVATALRELFEEVGVGAEDVSVVEQLPELMQASSRLHITPVVGVLHAGTRFAIDGNEIAGVFTVPLESILTAGAIYDDTQLSKARGRPMYAFDYQKWHVWGFTARILKSFADAWKSTESTLRERIHALAIMRP
jgi:8-oxo-dGTP pyrophosphatase MutT (NUDIX family)